MKVLIADDDPVSRRLLQVTLSNSGYETAVAVGWRGGSAFVSLRKKTDPRLVGWLDWIMPNMDGVEVCRTIRRRHRRNLNSYIILLTVKGQAAGDPVEGLESGADDYITKPFHPQELRARLRVGLRMIELESSLVEARERLQFKASHDALTSIWNRGAIIELLERELSRARREGSSVGILLADVDHFKNINDTWGHLVGDEVLRAVTGRLKAEVRSYDAVGRYGGEEFLILLPGCDRTKLETKAEQLRRTADRSPIETVRRTCAGDDQHRRHRQRRMSALRAQ